MISRPCEDGVPIFDVDPDCSESIDVPLLYDLTKFASDIALICS